MSEHAIKLRQDTAAVSVTFTWMGTRRALTPAQKQQAADVFEAQGAAIAASKQLFHTKTPTFRKLTNIKHQARDWWHSVTLPFTEPGVRLIARNRLPDFMAKITAYQAEISAAAGEMQAAFEQIKSEAQDRLGELFDSADYPETIQGHFGVEAAVVAVEPPDYLKQLSPALYEAEVARVTARFDEAVKLAETAFTEEFAKLTENLANRLTGRDADGKPRVFKDASVENLREFFERFKSLNIGSNADLDALVEKAKGMISGISPDELRENTDLRAIIGAQMADIRTACDSLMVVKPTRKITRNRGAKVAQDAQTPNAAAMTNSIETDTEF